MKKYSILVILLGGLTLLQLPAQTNVPEHQLAQSQVTAHMNFLAADELQGRRTGSPGLDIAARYIASHFAASGLEFVPGMDSYYQEVPYEEVTPPASGRIGYQNEQWDHGEDLLFLQASTVDEPNARFVFAGYGLKSDTLNNYEHLDVAGKIVVTFLGLPGEENPSVVFSSTEDKIRWAKEEGAIGLVEMYRLRFPWSFVNRYFNKPRVQLAEEVDESDQDFFYAWLNDSNGEWGEAFQEMENGRMSVTCSGSENRRFSAPNVMAFLPGTDPELRDEVVILSAHYDHVGVGEQGGGRYSEEDSIFNGARDNAFGTVAVLAAAKALSSQPPARSVIFMTFSGEELGLLGSRYYSEHPTYPLEQTVFNLNSDGAGYNDKEAVSIIGYGRMTVDDVLDQGTQAFGLNIIANPAPEQGLFDRSDNVNFARQGVPAVDFAPGMSSFNREINKYYHQVADNPETIDMGYLLLFCQSFAYTARLIADMPEAPVWHPGDKYEEASLNLYGR